MTWLQDQLNLSLYPFNLPCLQTEIPAELTRGCGAPSPGAHVTQSINHHAEARADRRCVELKAKGVETDYESVLKDIIYRDEQDVQRAAAPLKAAEDAVLVDTSLIDFDESFALLCSIICEKLGIEKV